MAEYRGTWSKNAIQRNNTRDGGSLSPTTDQEAAKALAQEQGLHRQEQVLKQL